MSFRKQSNSLETSFFKQIKVSPKLGSFLFSALTIVFSTTAISGAWVPKINTGYNKFAVSEFNADDFFGGNPNQADFSGRNYSFYGEYGIHENFAIYGSVLYQQLEQSVIERPSNQLVNTKSNGLGDAEIGIRYQWQAEPFVLSTSFLAKLPFLYDEDDALPRGNGQEDYEVRLLIGKSLNKYGYFGLEAGYRVRTSTPSDEYRYLVEYGFSVNDNLYFRTKIDSNISANNADTVINTTTNLAISSEFDLTKIELTAGWNFDNAKSSKDKWGFEVTYRKDLEGENTLKGDGIEFGLTHSF